eukprot:m.1162036 g.1162036  ORF g.1162036 m.1162036 type:complete len:295 (-) comp24501_c0_seq154:835-1719(-)
MWALTFLALVVSASGNGGVQQRSIESDIERLGEEAARTICTYAVGKLEGDVNSWVCDEVTAEALGLAASLLAETGLAEVVEDPLVAATARHYCEEGLSVLENDAGLSPDSVCDDLGVYRQRRTDLVARSLVAPFNFNTSADVYAAWSADTTGAAEKYLQARNTYMRAHDIPAAVFSDGTVGLCRISTQSGSYECMSSGYYRNSIASSTAGNLAQTSLQQSSGSSAHSGNSNGAIVGVVVLSCVVVVVALYAARMHVRVRQLEADADVADTQTLLAETSAEPSTADGVAYAEYTD